MRGACVEGDDGSRVQSEATLVRLPSDKFTSDGYRTVTLEEWKRCQANTYGPERV